SLSNLGGQGKKSTISFYVLEIIQQTLSKNAETTTREMQKVWTIMAELKGNFKHPQLVLVWGGISRQGRSKILIFSGLMDADFYVNEVLMKGLLEFGSCKYDRQYKLMQDNVSRDENQRRV
uniref:Uncharacterized protein n=1 Tax=Romanomermis culicivorax TaxID=13658 RepID=A0A915K7E8_ROMCU